MTDDEDERRVQATAAAQDAKGVVEALVSLNLSRSFGLHGNNGEEAKVDWPRAAAAIEAGLNYLNLSYFHYGSLAAEVARCPDDMSCASLKSSLARWRGANWEALAGVVREEAAKAARRTSNLWDTDFTRFLSEWPRLRDDRELLEAAIAYAETAGKAINGALTNLRHLTGGNEDAKRVLRFVVGNRYVDNDLVGRLLHDWAGTSTWGQLHYDLWVSEKGDTAEPREVAPDVAVAAAELRQLPLIVGTKAAEVRLSEMWDHHASRQPHVPGDRRYGLSEERRNARTRRADGEPCLDPHDAALRPPRRRSDARRGGTDTRLIAPEARRAESSCRWHGNAGRLQACTMNNSGSADVEKSL
jgi:hypothetical protein